MITKRSSIFLLIYFSIILVLSSATSFPSFIDRKTLAETSPVLSQTISRFQVYENSTLGIKMQYPFGWKKIFDNTSGTLELGVQFISPRINPQMKKADVVLKVEDLSKSPFQLQLKDLVKLEIMDGRKTYSNYSLIESTPITIAGIPAYKTVSTSTILGKHIQFMDIRLISNNKLYSITFGTGLTEYPLYLPIVQKMINSFEVNSSDVHTPNIEIENSNGANSNLIYENPDFGIKLEYPSTWRKVDYHANFEQYGGNILASFIAPQKNKPSGILTVQILSVHTKNIDPAQYDNLYLNSLRENKDFELNESNTNVTLGGNPAHMLKYIYTDESVGGVQNALSIYTINGNRVYTITFQAPPEKYLAYLPTVQKMIESFEIRNITPASKF
jgi:PsbP-like protein